MISNSKRDTFHHLDDTNPVFDLENNEILANLGEIEEKFNQIIIKRDEYMAHCKEKIHENL